MSPLGLTASVIVVVGGVVALGARDRRWALGGIAAILLVAPLAGGSIPPVVALGARTSASLLGIYVAWLVLEDAPVPVRGSAFGWPADAVAALAAGVAGWAAATGAGDLLGGAAASPPAVGAAVALAVLAAGPLVSLRDPFRLGLAFVLLAVAAGLAWAGLPGAAGPVDQLIIGCLGLGALGCQAVLVRSVAQAR